MMVCQITLMVGILPAQAFDLGGLIDNPQVGTMEKSLLNGSPSTGHGAMLNGMSAGDQIGGLKQALAQAAESAVGSLAQVNGYLGNPAVRIPLPAPLQRVNELLQPLGMGQYGDDLTTTINRAAEAAVPEAKALFMAAIQDMTVQDAKGILTGGNDAATQFFRSKTEIPLAEKFRPIVEQSMVKVQLAQKYNEFAAQGVKLGVIKPQDANMNDYITHKALDGLYTMMAQQEKAIRANPMQATGALARKVFSAIHPNLP
ncbi:MAG: DUF4197 domain-containing protein [Ferrovum sp.]|nr:DUF4197 domain-containing protein [Ferrovum sp.]NDU87796.1 DUF4197 domain-containing protein [Ferrovum sp.]